MLRRFVLTALVQAAASVFLVLRLMISATKSGFAFSSDRPAITTGLCRSNFARCIREQYPRDHNSIVAMNARSNQEYSGWFQH
jgi:hypothetical protein